VAQIVTLTNVPPMPRPSSINPGAKLPQKVPWTGICETQNSPPLTSNGATIKIGLKPIRWMMRGTLVAVIAIAIGTTRKSTPVLTGE
jgi:hypothetical protein